MDTGDWESLEGIIIRWTSEVFGVNFDEDENDEDDEPGWAARRAGPRSSVRTRTSM